MGWVGCSGTPGRGLRDTPTGGQAEDTRAAGEQDLGCNRTTELVTGVRAALLTGRPPRGQGGGEAGWCQDPRARGHRSCARTGDRTPARPAAGSPNWSASGRKRLSRVKKNFNECSALLRTVLGVSPFSSYSVIKKMTVTEGKNIRGSATLLSYVFGHQKNAPRRVLSCFCPWFPFTLYGPGPYTQCLDVFLLVPGRV